MRFLKKIFIPKFFSVFKTAQEIEISFFMKNLSFKKVRKITTFLWSSQIINSPFWARVGVYSLVSGVAIFHPVFQRLNWYLRVFIFSKKEFRRFKKSLDQGKMEDVFFSSISFARTMKGKLFWDFWRENYDAWGDLFSFFKFLIVPKSLTMMEVFISYLW